MDHFISLHLDADPDEREKQIVAFKNSHYDWQEYKRKLFSQETKAAPLSDTDVEQLLGTEYLNEKNVENTNLTLENLVQSLFRPGMKFVGTICIPSLGNVNHNNSDESDQEETQPSADDDQRVDSASGNAAAADSGTQLGSGDRTANTSSNNTVKEPYELVILDRGKDDFGNDFILGSHTAYSDMQCVYIDIDIRESDGQSSEQVLAVSYEDEETCIKGIWNPSSNCLEGCVRQRLQANDGAFHTSDEVTHVFALYPCTFQYPSGRGLGNASLQSSFHEDLFSVKTRALSELRNLTNSTGQECVSKYNNIFKTDGLAIGLRDLYDLKSMTTLSDSDNVSESMREVWKLRDTDWGNLSKCCSMSSERICARFRYRADLLDRATFHDIEEKRLFFEKWERAGFCLAAAHAEWDFCDNYTTRVFTIAFILCQNLGAVQQTMQVMMYTGSSRLHQNFNNLESSWRRANARKPTDFLAQFEVSSREISHQFTCSICFDGIAANEDLDVLCRLPCSHCYHGSCLKRWFHNNVTCPTCRSPVTGSDNDSQIEDLA